MSDNENRAVGEEQPKGGYEEQASENTASYVDGEGEGGGLQALAMKKKMSRIKSRTGTKSRTAVNRKNVGDTDRKVQEVMAALNLPSPSPPPLGERSVCAPTADSTAPQGALVVFLRRWNRSSRPPPSPWDT